MPKLTDAEILARDAGRDLDAELLADLNALKAGAVGRVSVVKRDGRVVESPVTKVRLATKLSQPQFAALLGVSVRTLQDWEQGRREPTGAARSLLKIAAKRPDVIREALA